MNQAEQTGKKSNQKRLKRFFKTAFMGLLVLCVAAGVGVAAMPKPVPVEATQVRKGQLVITVNEDGTARVKDRYVVSAPLAGNLARIELRAGDEIKQGQVVARLVPSRAPLLDARSRSQTEADVAASYAGVKQAQAQVERASAALEFSRKETGRYKQLRDQKVITEQEMERLLLDERSREAELTSARFGEKVAAHKLTMAQAALGHYADADNKDALTVTSPVSGRVLRLIQQSEGVVQAGTPLLEVGDPAALELVVDVLTSDAVSIKPGHHVQIDEWGGPPLNAVVRNVEPSAFTRVSALGVDEQRVNAVIDLRDPYDKWAALGDGYRVEARIEVLRTDDVLLVPQSALFRASGQWATYLLVDDVARLTRVSVGRRNDQEAEITAGLSPGARLVVHPSEKVKDGVSVQVHK